MKRALGIAAVTTFAVVGLAGPAAAEKPNDPGCFGQTRAHNIHNMAPGEWGEMASDRAGDNSWINADWKAANCS